MTALLFLSMIAFFTMGMPIAFSLGVASVTSLTFGGSSLPMTVAAQRLFTGCDSFPLMAIPFFMLAGALMETGGISKRLVDLAHSVVGAVWGGLGMVAVLAAMFFAGISGSAAADTAAIGTLSIPAMIRKGYPKGLAAAIQASGGTIGVIIPPSIPMVIYGVLAGVSIGKLFLGGFIPGVIIGLGLMAMSYVWCRKAGYGRDHKSTFKEFLTNFSNAVWALIMPLIILGGILGGVFTPTEAAVIACFYSLFVGIFIYRELDWRDLPRIFVQSAIATSTVMLIIGTANIFAWILAAVRIPQNVAAFMLGFTNSPAMIYLLVLIILLIIGTFMETSASIIILTPVFLPVIQKFGIDPIHFGVVMVVALAIGMLTPPLGICLFIACNIAEIPMSEIIKYLFWPLAIMIGCLFVITYVPWTVMYIPSLYGG